MSLTLQEAKEQIAKQKMYRNFHHFVSTNSYSAHIEALELAFNLVLSSKDKEIAELKVHNEQMVNDCNLYRRKSNDYYCQNDKLQSELSQLKEEKDKIENLAIQQAGELDEQADKIQSLQEEIEKIKESTKLDIEDLQGENAALIKDNSELAETVISLREEMKKKEWISAKEKEEGK